MRIKTVKLNNFKRFSNLLVEDIPSSAKIVILVGSNGSGKTSFIEAFNHWYRVQAFNALSDQLYIDKKTDETPNPENWNRAAREKVVITFHDAKGNADIKGRFYFRSAYRNEADFHIQKLTNQPNPKNNSIDSLMINDNTVSTNYQRLITATMSGVFDENNDNKSIKELRNDLIGRIAASLSNVFNDLNLNSLGNPLQAGNFYFAKGLSKNFHYKNLSGGEKSAFDLILDMIIKSHHFENAIYCIDEPESHMHTRLQGKVLRELYSLLPTNSQLWITTHSIGMLEEARQIEMENPGTVVFLDFDDRDFDSEVVMKPSRISKAVMDKFYDLVFGDFSRLILPKRVVFCEGTQKGRTYKNFDALIFSSVFVEKHFDTQFISSGSSNEIERIDEKFGEVMTSLLKSSQIIKIVDRDGRSNTEIAELAGKGVKVLKKRHIECYLLDDEIITKLCNVLRKPDKAQECIDAKHLAIQDSVNRGHPNDDVKSASGEICNSLRRILEITQGGNNTCSFLRDTLAPLITEETAIYKQLEQEIFNSEDAQNG